MIMKVTYVQYNDYSYTRNPNLHLDDCKNVTPAIDNLLHTVNLEHDHFPQTTSINQMSMVTFNRPSIYHSKILPWLRRTSVSYKIHLHSAYETPIDKKIILYYRLTIK